MNRQQFAKLHTDLCTRARALTERKGHDYATEADVLSNVRLCEHLGLTATATGILVRMADKLSRMAQLSVKNKQKVTDESIIDTALDLINYTVIFIAIREEKSVPFDDDESEAE